MINLRKFYLVIRCDETEYYETVRGSLPVLKDLIVDAVITNNGTTDVDEHCGIFLDGEYTDLLGREWLMMLTPVCSCCPA